LEVVTIGKAAMVVAVEDVVAVVEGVVIKTITWVVVEASLEETNLEEDTMVEVVASNNKCQEVEAEEVEVVVVVADPTTATGLLAVMTGGINKYDVIRHGVKPVMLELCGVENVSANDRFSKEKFELPLNQLVNVWACLFFVRYW